jgi:hypothetical protein
VIDSGLSEDSQGQQMSEFRSRRTLLRQVNEQMRRINADFAAVTSAYHVVCECERPECLERLQVPARVYEEVRGDSERFVLIAGHEQPGVERVLASADGYCVVRVPSEPMPLPA